MKPKEPAEPGLPEPASEIEALLREIRIAEEAMYDPRHGPRVQEAKRAEFWRLDARLEAWTAANGPIPQEARDAVQRTHPDVQTRVRMNHPNLYARE